MNGQQGEVVTGAPGRVVITGRGAVSAAGHGVAPLLAAVEEGRQLIGPATFVGEADSFGTPVAEVPALMGTMERPRLVEMAQAAAAEALREAGIAAGAHVDLVLGTSAGARSEGDWTLAGRQAPCMTVSDGEDRFGAVTHMLQEALGLTGRAVTINTGCSSGANAVAYGYQLVASGRAERVLCVGVEELWMGYHLSMKLMGALASGACEPFHQSVGTTMGEGAGALLLEAPQSAGRRAPPIHAEILGVGQSADAFHATRPDPSGEGPGLAVSRAIEQAGIRCEDVAVICGHGTGTAAGDSMELALYARTFGSHVPTFGTKGVHAHTTAACGPLELIVLIEHLAGHVVPAPRCWADDVAADARSTPHPTAGVGLKTTYAMGGLNTAIVVSTNEARDTPRRPRTRALCVAEVGLWGAAALGDGPPTLSVPATLHDGLVHMPSQSDMPLREVGSITRKEWQRMDLLSRLVVVATGWLLGTSDAGLADTGIAYATQWGPVLSWTLMTHAVNRQEAINPAVLPRLSYNAAPSWASRVFGLRGPTVAFVSGRSAGLDALEYAALCVELGMCEAMIVVAADEYTGPKADDESLAHALGTDIRAEGFEEVHARIGNAFAHPALAAMLVTSQTDRQRSEDWAPVPITGEDLVAILEKAQQVSADDRLQSAGPLLTVIDEIATRRTTLLDRSAVP